MKKILLQVAVITGCCFCLFVQSHAQEIGLLGGSTAGTYIKFAQDIREIAQGVLDINVSPGGSLSNIEKVLHDKHTQFAIVQYDALLYYETFKFQQLREKIKMILPLYHEEIHLIARKDAHINHVRDLNGKRVNMDKQNSGCWVTATVMREKLGFDWQEYNYVPAEALRQLLSGNIDAFIYTCGKPAPVLAELGADVSERIKLVPIELEGVYVDSIIEQGTYPWQEGDIRTKATTAVLISYNYTEEENAPERFRGYVRDIRTIIDLVCKNLDDLGNTKHPKWKEVDPARYKEIDWPVHSAAQAILDKNARGHKAE